MSTPVYATLGTADQDISQASVNLNIVDEEGKHVELDAVAALKAKTQVAALTSASTAADIVAALQS